jgi:membrane protein implicated in regulation of membrane protease activity
VTTFVVIGVVGLVLLLLTLVLGDLVEGLVDGVGPDWLSGTAIAAFLAAVGFGGALALQLGASEGVATASGIGAGLAAGALAGLLTRTLAREGDDGSTPRSDALLGQVATVVSDVPVDGYGTVALTVAGHPTRLNARAGAALPAGTQVRVTAVLSSSAVQVEPTSPANRPPA